MRSATESDKFVALTCLYFYFRSIWRFSDREIPKNCFHSSPRFRKSIIPSVNFISHSKFHFHMFDSVYWAARVLRSEIKRLQLPNKRRALIIEREKLVWGFQSGNKKNLTLNNLKSSLKIRTFIVRIKQRRRWCTEKKKSWKLFYTRRISQLSTTGFFTSLFCCLVRHEQSGRDFDFDGGRKTTTIIIVTESRVGPEHCRRSWVNGICNALLNVELQRRKKIEEKNEEISFFRNCENNKCLFIFVQLRYWTGTHGNLQRSTQYAIDLLSNEQLQFEKSTKMKSATKMQFIDLFRVQNFWFLSWKFHFLSSSLHVHELVRDLPDFMNFKCGSSRLANSRYQIGWELPVIFT